MALTPGNNRMAPRALPGAVEQGRRFVPALAASIEASGWSMEFRFDSPGQCPGRHPVIAWGERHRANPSVQREGCPMGWERNQSGKTDMNLV